VPPRSLGTDPAQLRLTNADRRRQALTSVCAAQGHDLPVCGLVWPGGWHFGVQIPSAPPGIQQVRSPGRQHGRGFFPFRVQFREPLGSGGFLKRPVGCGGGPPGGRPTRQLLSGRRASLGRQGQRPQEPHRDRHDWPTAGCADHHWCGEGPRRRQAAAGRPACLFPTVARVWADGSPTSTSGSGRRCRPRLPASSRWPTCCGGHGSTRPAGAK
jgi:hypothetical protein